MTRDSFQIGLLSEVMAREQAKQRIISQNIANVNTPRFQAREVDFKTTLREVAEGKVENPGEARHIVVKSAGLHVREDGNNVDIDRELGKLDKNAMLYASFTQILSGKLSMLRTAITGR